MSDRPLYLRDARLKKALDSAPDAAGVPAEWTRSAIKNAAQWPAAKTSPASWWRRLWGGDGAPMPWNAAFATVLLAGFVTVFWHGQEVPDATPDQPAQMPPVSSAPAPQAVDAAPSAAPAGKAATAPAPAVVAMAPPAAAQKAAANDPRRAERERAADLARAREDRTAERQAVASPSPSVIATAPPVFPAPAPVPPELAAAPPPAAPPVAAMASPPPVPVAAAPVPAPATVAADARPAGGASAGFAAGGVARPVARAITRDGAAVMAEAQPQPAAKSVAASGPVLLLPPAVPAEWAAARLTLADHAPATLARARSGALQQRLQNLLAGFNLGEGAGAAPAVGAVRVELLNTSGERLALLTVDGAALRWVVVQPGGAEKATLGRADAATLEALRAELERLLTPLPVR